uniref:PGG domain-containing protein n=1 Tax=Aegilops tauschii subsp. strangulata TaxID=200361 RepID=A0A453FWG3_AEGTS
MASRSSGDEPSSLLMEENAVQVSVDAKLTVAAGRGNCQQLKDLLSTEDSKTMLVVMAPSIQASTVKPLPEVMSPLLLSSACSGAWQDLEFLLNRGHGQPHPSMNSSTNILDLLTAYGSHSCSGKGASMQKASDDVEALLNLPSGSTVSLLDGVTIEGGTALHVNGDTPLHCAARAGMSRMVCHLITLARGENTGVNRVKELLEIENILKETALHQAVRIGNNDIVKLLMEEHSELASFPKDGTSPLYLAILLEEDIIVETLYNASHMKLSYSGKNGQNALHAAVLRGTGTRHLSIPLCTGKFDLQSPEITNAAQNGLEKSLFAELTKKLLEWNSDLTTQRDENGSTPLHFAAALAQQRNRHTHLNLSNNIGQTPLDISLYGVSPGIFDDQISEAKIHFALTVVNARSGGSRRDHFEENYTRQLKYDETEQLEKLKESTQTLCIGVALIATATFTVTFALPGGYKADEHINGGTPTLAGRLVEFT